MQAERFVQQIAESQNRLYGYIFSLIGDHDRAADILQETNLVLWRKQDEFQPDRSFLPWAFSIARFQVLAHVRDQSRDKWLLDPQLVDQLATEAESQASQLDVMQAALRRCLGELTDRHRDMIQRRYYRSASIAEIAEALDRGASAVKVTLMRVRRQLAQCIERRVQEA